MYRYVDCFLSFFPHTYVTDPRPKRDKYYMNEYENPLGIYLNYNHTTPFCQSVSQTSLFHAKYYFMTYFHKDRLVGYTNPIISIEPEGFPIDLHVFFTFLVFFAPLQLVPSKWIVIEPKPTGDNFVLFSFNIMAMYLV